MPEAWHDAVTAQPDRDRATGAAHAFGHGPEQISGRRELARGRGAELELPAGEVAWLRSPARGQRRSHRAVTLARHAVARDASHRVDVTPHRDTLWVLPRHVRALVPRERVLVCHHRPALFDGELTFPRRHRRAFALERFHLAAFAHPPEPVVVPHLGDAVLV